jgi:hypothetical protein
MTWIKTYGQVSLSCDDCIAPAEQLVEELEGEETHHEASARLWAAAARDGWRSAQQGVLHSCPDHSGAEPW